MTPASGAKRTAAAAATVKSPFPVLTPEQIHDFFEIGYFKIPALFKPEEIREISEAFDRLLSIAKQLTQTTVYRGSQFVVEGNRIDRIVWMGAAEPGLLKFGEDPRLTYPVSQLLGSATMEQLICQGHYKLPGDTVKFDWHQDSQHRGYGTADWNDLNGKGSFVQTLMAIDDNDLDNGPVYFAPRTGKRGHLGLDKMKDPTSCFNVNETVPMLLGAGDVAFFSPYVIHGSHANESNRSRRVFINGYCLPGANRRAYPGDGSGRTVIAPTR